MKLTEVLNVPKIEKGAELSKEKKIGWSVVGLAVFSLAEVLLVKYNKTPLDTVTDIVKEPKSVLTTGASVIFDALGAYDDDTIDAEIISEEEVEE